VLKYRVTRKKTKEQLSFFGAPPAPEAKAPVPARTKKKKNEAEKTPDSPVYSVSQLNREIHDLLEKGFPPIWLEGEISNFRHHTSGHMYLTLKDANAEIDAVMFSDQNALLSFEPNDGQKVLAFGHVTLYERRGKYQIEIAAMKPAGIGQLQLAYEKLKARLQAEGLFDTEHKKPIAGYPWRIGIVTSAEAAALRDMLKIISQRFPAIEVLIFPAKVQGEGAAQSIAQAIRQANLFSLTVAPIETLIVGRGGGSLEDLWAFNEDPVARALYESAIPTISAVGHEVDVTIADFVADLRAPTPTAAAQMAVPDARELFLFLQETSHRLARAQKSRLDLFTMKLDLLRNSRGFRKPIERLREGQQSLDYAKEMLWREMKQKLKSAQGSASNSIRRLESLNPAKILQRGFSVIETEAGQPVKSTREIAIGDQIRVKLYQGRLQCRVTDKEEEV
jgi:exodeoxyribonuclease VII large subunit